MKKTVFIAVTFAICRLLKLEHLWLGVVPAMISIIFFRFSESVLWEIPLAVLSCSVLEIAFANDIKLLLQLLVLFGTAVIYFASPKRLMLFFPIAVIAMIFENIYSAALLWGALWAGSHIILCDFTTKRAALQEYKL